MKPLPPLRKGPRNLRKWLNGLYDAVVANRLLRSDLCELHETPGGTLILPNVQAIATAAAETCIGAIYDASDRTDGFTLKLGFGYRLIAGRQPDGFHAGNYPPFIAPNDTIPSLPSPDGYIYAKALWDATHYRWSTVSFIVDSDPTLNATTAYALQLIASYHVEGTTVTIVNAVCGDITFTSCDLGTEDPP